MTNDIYIFSLGQLAASNLTKSVAAFSAVLEKESNFPFFTTTRIYASLAADQIYYKTIDNYKLGNINSDEFKTRISNQLGIKESDEFENAWNSMCELTPEASKKIVNVFALQQKEHFKLCIVSATNPLQYDYTIKSINVQLEKLDLQHIDENPNVKIVTSFKENTLSLPELARVAIQKNGWDSDEYNIISFDNRLTQESLMLKNANFTYDMEQKLFFTGEVDQNTEF